jgi:hypothetical protein
MATFIISRSALRKPLALSGLAARRSISFSTSFVLRVTALLSP